VWVALNALNPQTVLVPGYYTLAGLATAVWSKLHGRRSVLMTESTEGDHHRSWWKELPKRIVLRTLFDWAIAGGAPHRRYLLRLGFRADRIGRFYDVVDNEFFACNSRSLRSYATAEDFGLPSSYFLYVGRLAEEKNVAGLLRSYMQYRLLGGCWPLVLVGDGPERPRLEQISQQSNYASDIRFEGLRHSADLAQYYAFAGCFVLPSKREPWGLVVNEAMASGLPVIVSNRCGCAEELVRGGENGFVFNSDNDQELTGRLLAIAELTPERRGAMGARSFEIVSEFSLESWAAEVARIVRA
jgi:glycosyltransferase involved in cell wall biosynthesis